MAGTISNSVALKASRAAMQRLVDKLFPERSHLSVDEVVAHVDGRLNGDALHAVHLHLSTCAQCRAEIADVQRITASAPMTEFESVADAKPTKATVASRTRAFRKLGFGTLAAAALLLVFIQPTRDFRRNRPQSPAERASPNVPVSSEFAALFPLTDGVVERSALRFVWARNGNATYHLFLTDSSGVPVFDAFSTDTAMSLPEHLRLEPSKRYFWYVDALRSDGTLFSSGLKEFVIRP